MVAARQTLEWNGPIDIGLGSAIRTLQADFGLDDHGLASALGVDRRTLARWAAPKPTRRRGRGRVSRKSSLSTRS
jgi:hypothetical protein